MSPAPGRRISFIPGAAGSGTPMDGTVREIRFIPAPWILPVAGILLLAAGAALILWSDPVLDLLAVLLGALDILVGLGCLAAAPFLLRAGIHPLPAILAGFLLLITGFLVILWHDVVIGLLLWLGAGLSLIAGLSLLLLGGLISVPGPARWILLGGGGVLLASGLSLLLFPAATGLLLLDIGGIVLAGAGCLVLLLTVPGRAGTPPVR